MAASVAKLQLSVHALEFSRTHHMHRARLKLNQSPASSLRCRAFRPEGESSSSSSSSSSERSNSDKESGSIEVKRKGPLYTVKSLLVRAFGSRVHSEGEHRKVVEKAEEIFFSVATQAGRYLLTMMSTGVILVVGFQHGGYAGRRIEERRPIGRRSKGIGIDNKKGKKKAKSVSIKNQIRSTERMLRKNLPPEVREAQEQKLNELKKHQELQSRLAVERKLHLRDKKIKFFERRKIERMIRRLEKQHRASSDHASEEKISDQLSRLKVDLEYVRFFPKTEKYVSLFVGGDSPAIVIKRNELREQIKANRVSAAANGKDLEETASDDDALDMSDDDFFLSGSSSEEAEADDELTDISTREHASSASGKAASGMSSDERDQRQMSARVLMPPPRALPSNRNRSAGKVEVSSSSNTSNTRSGPSLKSGGSLNSWTDHNSNLSSNSDARKPRRKRRPKKKKQA